MTLPGKMINLRRLHLCENPAQGRAIREIAVVEKKPRPIDCFIRAQVLDPQSPEIAGSPNDPMDGVAFLQK